MTTLQTPPELNDFAEAVCREPRIVLTTHVRPDGDAIGSTLAIAAILLRLGAEVWLWHEEGAPVGFEILGEHVWHETPPAEIGSWAAIALDCASFDRVAADEQIMEAYRFLQLDHHASNTQFADWPNIVIPEASSTCEIVAALADLLNVELSPEIAAPLFFGLWTDTGGFRYSNTSASTLALRDRLADALGAERHAELVEQLTYVPLAWKAYGQIAVDRLYEPAPGILFAAIRDMDRKVSGLSPDEQKFANDVALNMIQERPAKLHVLWYETASGGRHVSLRSQAIETPCGELAKLFGGGGHPAAAGFTTDLAPEQVATAITDALAAQHAASA